MRRRVLLGVVALLVVGAAVFAVARTLGGSAPEDTAARLVPATALVYVHLSTDPDREEDQRLVETLQEFPAAETARAALTQAIGSDFDIGRDVRPWLGEEAAFALLDTGASRADSLLLLSVRDRPKAEAFLGRASGSRGSTTYRGVPIQRFTGVSVAFAGGFMAIGQDSAVRAAIDRAQGRGAAFSTSVAYRRATGERPEERVVDVVVTFDGVQRVLAPAPGFLGALGGLLSHPDLIGVGATVSAEEDGLRMTVRQARRESPGREFEPTLVGEVPRAAAAYLGVSGLEAFAALVPEQVREALGAAVESASLDVEEDLVAPLRGEVALSVTPGLPVPTATLIARTSDAERTREALARLQVPLAELLAPPAAPQSPAPVFEQRALGEVQAFSLAIAPGVELTYAVTGDRLIVSTSANGVGHVLADRAALTGSAAFERVVGDLPDRVEAVLFVDLGQLLALAEQAGSTGDPAFEAVQDDLRKLRVAGATVQREETDSTAELFFEIP